MELIKARGPAVQAAEAIPPRMDPEEGLNLSIHEELVAQNAIEIEQVEKKQSIRVEHPVREQEGYVELVAGQVKPAAFVTRVLVVVEDGEAGEPLVDVLRGEIHAVVVVPERAQAFPHISPRRMSAVVASQPVGVVMVVVLP